MCCFVFNIETGLSTGERRRESISNVDISQLRTDVIVNAVTKYLAKTKRSNSHTFKSVFCEPTESFTAFFSRIGPEFSKMLLTELGFSTTYVGGMQAAWSALHRIDVSNLVLLEKQRNPLPASSPFLSPVPPIPQPPKRKKGTKRKKLQGNGR